MDIKTNSEIEKQLVHMLLELGFPQSSLRSGFKTPYGKYIDLVIFESNMPKVVFEVKTNVSLQTSSNNNEGFRFHPAVRQAQLLAQEINAPYFAVFDGVDLLWFEVDKSEGRPKLLEKPILPTSQTKEDSENSKTQILNLLFALGDLGRGQFPREKYLTNVGLTILARLWSEAGNTALEKLLTLQNLDIESFDNNLLEQKIIRNNADKNYYTAAFSYLSNTSLLNTTPDNFIAAIDDFIQFNMNQFKFSEFKLPLWISELMGSLAKVNHKDNILDIYSNFGDGVFAAYKVNNEARVFSISSIEISYIFDKIKRLILGLNIQDVLYAPIIDESTQSTIYKKFNNQIARVIVSPPFGAKLGFRERHSFQRSEEFFLDIALRLSKPNGRVISIIPESLLLSPRSKAFREYLLESAWVSSIISIEQFLPSSSVKASILVLDKKSPDGTGQNILMCKITGKDIENLSGSNQSISSNDHIQKILGIYNAHVNHDNPKNQKKVWFVSKEQLDNNSWAVDFYNPTMQFEINSEYPLLSLGELATLRKGSPLRLDENGTLPVIGPGALRSLFIDPAKLGRTTEKNLSNKQVVAQVNDVLIHAVGTYRGEAALVESDFENSFINQNIIVLRDFSPKVLPAYLAIVLNSGFVKQQLEGKATGSVIVQYSIRKLNDLKIPIPTIETQKYIIKKVANTRQKLLEIEQQALVIESSHKEQEDNLKNILDNIHLGGGENA
jgi:type I restriction-modification system DNA methylase subunit